MDNFAKKAIEYKYYNHLAHIMFFGCGNEKENYTSDSQTLEETKYFKKAMDLTVKLNNERLMIAAWRKNVFMAQGYGLFGFVDYYYKRCLEIIERQYDEEFEESDYFAAVSKSVLLSYAVSDSGKGKIVFC